MPENQRRGLLWAFGASLGIAGFAVPWKLANQGGETAVNTLILLGSAAVFSTLLSSVQNRGLPRFGRFDFLFAAALAIFTLLGNLASGLAIARISPALLTVVQRGEIIVVALLAWPLVGERINRSFWVGALIAACGLWILQGPMEGGSPERTTGVAWAGFSVLCFSTMAVLTRKYVQRIDTVAVNGLRLWMAVLLWFIPNGLQPILAELPTEQIAMAALAGFCGPFAGRLCMMNAARYLEARISALVTLLAPPLTLLLAFVVLDNLPTQREFLGGAIMLAGVAVPILASRRRPVAA